MRKWFSVFEGTGKQAHISGTESWGEVWAIVEADSVDKVNCASAIYVGFILEREDAAELVQAHNRMVDSRRKTTDSVLFTLESGCLDDPEYDSILRIATQDANQIRSTLNQYWTNNNFEFYITVWVNGVSVSEIYAESYGITNWEEADWTRNSGNSEAFEVVSVG